MQSLVEITELETQINFEKAEKESEALIHEVKKLLPPEMLSEFLMKTVHYRMKKLRRGDFYGYLARTARMVLSSEQLKARQNALQYLRYIQALLGHNSSKTTEIYTHVTRKGFDKIKSPLDNLDL